MGVHDQFLTVTIYFRKLVTQLGTISLAKVYVQEKQTLSNLFHNTRGYANVVPSTISQLKLAKYNEN